MDKKIIDQVREYYSLPETVTDDEIERELKNSFGAAVCQLATATEELKSAIFSVLPKWMQRLFKGDV